AKSSVTSRNIRGATYGRADRLPKDSPPYIHRNGFLLMSDAAKIFAVNTYSYTFDWTAADCIRHLADQGYPGFELMMYPGHLWPSEADAATKRDIVRAYEETGTRIVSFNMPNIDLNIVGAS